MQSHPGSLAAQCRTLTTGPPGNPNLCYPGLLSAAWAGAGKGIWEMLSCSACECSLCKRKDPKGGMILCLDGCWEGVPFLSAKSCLVIWRCFSWWSITKESLSFSSWAAPGDTSKIWPCQLSLCSAALFAWGSSCGGAEPNNSFRELEGPWKGLKEF